MAYDFHSSDVVSAYNLARFCESVSNRMSQTLTGILVNPLSIRDLMVLISGGVQSSFENNQTRIELGNANRKLNMHFRDSKRFSR